MSTSETTEKSEPYPTIRLKGDRIILKLGSEQCELTLDDLTNLAMTIHSRINEVKDKQRRDPERIAAWQRQWDKDNKINRT